VRPLRSALIAEGASDVAFLLPILQAQLERIGWDAEFDAGPVRRATVTTVMSADSVVAEAAELLEVSDLLFVHHDHRESAKIDRLRERLEAEGRVVGVVPVRETEAWVLAAACGLEPSIAAFDAASPERGCRWVEKLADPKAELKRRYRGPASVEDLFTLIAERVDLDRLAEVPAYQSFLQYLTAALKELNFL
jgi:Domain of unknown function (DUF4276)